MKLPVNYNHLTPVEKRQVREEYAKRQKGLCYHCKKPLDGLPCDSVRKLSVTKRLYPPGFFDYPVHLHHDHNTGLTIGAVHNYCNAVLWEYYGE